MAVTTFAANGMASTNQQGRRASPRAIEPMVEMNTTPLIDVMLVLLIMLIITIPPQTHNVTWDEGGDTLKLPVQPDRLKNELIISPDGSLFWNGILVTDRQVRAMLALTATMEPRPELHLRPNAAARYERVDQVMAMVKQSGVTAFGFVGNAQYQGSF